MALIDSDEDDAPITKKKPEPVAPTLPSTQKKQDAPKKKALMSSDDSDEPITKPKPVSTPAPAQQKPQAKPNKALFGSDDEEASDDDMMASKKVAPKSALKNKNLV